MTPTIFDGYHGDNISSFWAMKGADIQLCIFKASQGLNFVDTAIQWIKDKFGKSVQSYAARAASTGMLVGAYHFGGNADGVAQAKKFLSLCQPGWLMVLDFERYQASQMTVRQAEDFCSYVLGQQGCLPILYYGELLLQLESQGAIGPKSILRACPGWGSRYGNNRPETIKGQQLAIWQYTGDGQGPLPHRVAGCDNDADLSVYLFGTPIADFVKAHSMKGVA